VISNGVVTAEKLHIPDLALARICKDSALVPAIGIAVLFAAIPSKQENVGDTIRRRDSTSLLTSIDVMNIVLAMVDPPF
jgi:hypothetical protein